MHTDGLGFAVFGVVHEFPVVDGHVTQLPYQSRELEEAIFESFDGTA